jgi:hypothetical protein
MSAAVNHHRYCVKMFFKFTLLVLSRLAPPPLWWRRCLPALLLAGAAACRARCPRAG